MVSFLLGNFYYTIGNISPEKRSHSSAIKQFAIVNSKHLKQYCMDPVLESLMDDIRLLEQVQYT